MASKCEQCHLEFVSSDVVAKCVVCTRTYHPACTRFGSTKSFTKRQTKTWKCEGCKGDDEASVKSTEEDSVDDIKSVLEAIASMKIEINSNTDKKVGEVATSIASLSSELKKLHEKHDELDRKHSLTAQRCDSLMMANAELRAELARMREDNIDRDQRARSANIEIQGIPVTPGEDIYYCLEKVAAALKIAYHRGDISVAHRLKLFSRKHAHAPIVVQFISRSKREEWLAAARRRRHLNATEIVGTFTSSSVHINEHLTPHNKELLGRARRMRREGKLVFAGYIGGKVLVKSSENADTIRVINVEDLDQFDK